MSEEIETLDEGLSEVDSEVTPAIQKLSGEIAPWMKVIAVVNLALQAISLIQTFLIGRPALLIFQVALSALTIGVNLVLLSWGNSTDRLSKQGSAGAFADAMLKQKSYWMFVGILTILGLIVFVFLMFMAFDDPRGFNRMMRDFV